MSNVYQRGREAFELHPDQMSAEQRAYFDSVTQGPRGRVPINLRAWLHNMPFSRVVEPFGLYVSAQAQISKREKEIIVLVNARCWQADFEWAMHEKHAKNAGISVEQIAAIRARSGVHFEDHGEMLSYRLADALHEDRKIPDALYQACMAHFGHQGVSDRIGLMGLYTMIAWTLNFYAVPAPGQ